MSVKPAIEECLHLLEKLEKEFPGEPDLEALHAVTGIYAELKKDRESINSFPAPVRRFCEFIHAARLPPAAMAKFLDFLRSHPDAFLSGAKEPFLQKRQRIAGIAGQAGFDPSQLFHLLSMARLKGLLDDKDCLPADHRVLIGDYLGY